MVGRWKSSGLALGAAALALSCTVAARAAEKPADDGADKNIWQAVERRIAMATKAGDRKAAETQLTKLSADDLFLCCQQFCDALPSAEGGEAELGSIYAVGVMLDLHQEKVGLEATLRAIGSAVGTTDNAFWAGSSLEWLVTLKKRKIPPAGMHAIAEGALRALSADAAKDRLKAQHAILGRVSDDDIWILFTPNDRARLKRRLKKIRAAAGSPELRTFAAEALRGFDRNEAEFKRELEQCEDPKLKAELRRRLYGPLQPQEGQPPNGGKGAR